MSTYSIICLFALLRPIFCVAPIADTTLGGLKMSEIFGLGFGYFFILLLLHSIKILRLDAVSIITFLLVSHMIVTLVWSPQFREISRLILPFPLLFVARSIQVNRTQLKKVIFYLILGYCVPLFMSFYLIINGRGIEKLNYFTELMRYQGAFANSHSLGHGMLVFIFILFVYFLMSAQDHQLSKTRILIISILGFIAVYCLYYSYVRTVMIGALVLTFVFLIKQRRYKLLIGATLFVFAGALFSGIVHKIFWDIYDPLAGKSSDYADIGSGRLGGWTSMVRLFVNTPLVFQIGGTGISSIGIIHSTSFSASHNDWLGMLIYFGFIGFCLYSLFMLSIAKLFNRVHSDLKMKDAFFAFLCTVAAENLFSNSFISRFELAQYFCLLIGLFIGYAQRTEEVSEHQNAELESTEIITEVHLNTSSIE